MINLYNYLKEILEDLPDAIVITNETGAISFVNSEANILFGYTGEELLGKEVEILVPPDLRAIHKIHVENYFSNPEKRKMAKHRPVKALRKDGTQFTADILLSPISDGLRMFAMSAVRDISDKLEEEESLRKRNKELELVNKELEKYGFTVSHDLKSPLSKIRGLVNIILDDLKDGKSYEELLETVDFLNDSVNAMGSLITEELDKSKSFYQENSLRHFNFNDVVKDLMILIDIPNNIEYTNYCKSVELLQGKKIEMLQVLLNLLSNAIKFNDKPKGIISLHCRDLGNFYEFIFEDNGSGISGDKKEELFELFNKGDHQMENSQGIGLYTAKKIVEKKGGAISFSSNSGIGTIFTFTWPKINKL